MKRKRPPQEIKSEVPKEQFRDRIESEFEANGLNGVIQKLDDAKRRGDHVEYDRLKRQIDDEVANMEGKMADGSDH